jgi:hypothetical protein
MRRAEADPRVHRPVTSGRTPRSGGHRAAWTAVLPPPTIVQAEAGPRAAAHNLGTGAAGLAVPNANPMLGLDETAALTAAPVWL